MNNSFDILRLSDVSMSTNRCGVYVCMCHGGHIAQMAITIFVFAAVIEHNFGTTIQCILFERFLLSPKKIWNRN